jgi:putative endonuclease
MGEDMAHRYLRGRGCTVVARNYRPPSGHGEIDLVVWHGEKLVFVEVKTRDTAEFGEPERAVDAEKQRHLTLVARNYARRVNVEWERVRFDVVAVVLSPRRVEWFRDTFR